MKSDYTIKNEILKCLLANRENEYCTADSISNYLNISKQRAEKLLIEILKDNYCQLRDSNSDVYQFVNNEDTLQFQKSGGYKGDSVFKKHPILEKILITILSSALSLLVGWLLLRSEYQSRNRSERKQDSILSLQNLRIDSIRNYIKDSLKIKTTDTTKQH